jgi:tRNA A-37 threonylcarbamoyl transferase component Bud32
MNMPQRFGQYILLERLTAGGMAELFRAKIQGVGGFEKVLAIKRIHPKYSEEEKFIKMMVDEAKITVRLNHVNIAQVFDLGQIDGMYYIAMEYIDGRDLYKLLRRAQDRGTRIPIEAGVFVAHELCAGLDYAHAKKDERGRPLGIIHRDVSPQNVLISFEGQVKLVDFGIAKHAIRSRETEAGIIKGKFSYMSPEQAWGDPIDPRSDVFSTGIVLYETLTGSMVYAESDELKLLDRIRKAEIPPPRRLRADIPEELDAIVMRALQKKPDARYQTAQEFQNALARFLYTRTVGYGAQKLAALMREWFPEGPAAERAPAEERETLSLGFMSRDEFPSGTAGSLLFEGGTSEGRGDRRVKTDPGAESDEPTRIWDGRKKKGGPGGDDGDYEENSDIVDSADGYVHTGEAKRPLAAAAAARAAGSAKNPNEPMQRRQTSEYEVISADDLQEVPPSVAMAVDTEHTVVDAVNPFYEGPPPEAKRPLRRADAPPSKNAAPARESHAPHAQAPSPTKDPRATLSIGSRAAALDPSMTGTARDLSADAQRAAALAKQPMAPVDPRAAPPGSTMPGMAARDAPPWQRADEDFTNVFTPPPNTPAAAEAARQAAARGPATPSSGGEARKASSAGTAAPSLLAFDATIAPSMTPAQGGDPFAHVPPPRHAYPIAPARRGRAPLLVALAVIAAGGGAAATWLLTRDSEPTPAVVVAPPAAPAPRSDEAPPAPSIPVSPPTPPSPTAAPNPALAANPAVPAPMPAATPSPAPPAPSPSAPVAAPAPGSPGPAVAAPVPAPRAPASPTLEDKPPGVKPEPKEAPPKAERVARKDAPPMGRVLVETKPDGASVYVDGDERGEAGEWIELPAGKEYEVEVRRRGYKTVAKSVEVGDGDQRLYFTLERAKKVRRAKKKRRRAKAAVARAAPQADAPAHPAPASNAEEADPEAKPEAPAEPGFVSVNAKPWGEVHVDGRKVSDQTPLLGFKLPAGKHRVRIYFVTLQKMSAERHITVAPGKTQTVFFRAD